MVKLHRASPVALEQNAQDDSVPLWIHVTSPDQGRYWSLISHDIRLWNENEQCCHGGIASPPQFNCNCQDRLSIFNPVNPSLDKSQPTPTLLLATVDINASKYEVTAKSFGRYNGDHHIPITDLPVNSLS